MGCIGKQLGVEADFFQASEPCYRGIRVVTEDWEAVVVLSPFFCWNLHFEAVTYLPLKSCCNISFAN